jgi:hypothetical protein
MVGEKVWYEEVVHITWGPNGAVALEEKNKRKKKRTKKKRKKASGEGEGIRSIRIKNS